MTAHDSPTPLHRVGRHPNFDRRPVVEVPDSGPCHVAWGPIAEAIAHEAASRNARVVAIDTYPGITDDDMHELVDSLGWPTIHANDALRDATEIVQLVAPFVTDDPVFGRLTTLDLPDFLDPEHQAILGDEVARARSAAPDASPVLVVGVGAATVAPCDLLVYASLPRWEIQQRQRSGHVGNLGMQNEGQPASRLYKQAYFVDWRVADRHKRSLTPTVDLLLDMTLRTSPRMITGDDWRRGLAEAASRPFRVVPFFDPGPWGGQWMREVCDLPDGPPNYAWCFDCVPEENSLLLGIGDGVVEVPSIDVVFGHPEELLGASVRARFGDEFPIRFDFLDTMQGGNLSLQVHPLTEYIQQEFGIHYTQDESYYLLDAEADATVLLGVRDDVDRDRMIDDLRRAQADPDSPFPAQQHINHFPARRHDHFLIPAGTVHCSGAGAMVLEISATPYIFTFKLWDWARLGLDGKPRPINIDRGLDNIQWHRDTTYAQKNLVNVVTPMEMGDGWRSERTGLHEAEFIDTHRHWFTDVVPHDTQGGVNVLNLVKGDEAVVESPTAAFEPFVVHYAETFIVPAAVGAYTIRPHGPAVGTECATIKAFVRP